MTVSLEDQTSVINLFNFVREIYDIKRPFNGNIENRYVSWDDINPNLPGITKWPDLNSDPNLLCIIERLPHPERPAPASELSEWLLHGNGDEISFRESLEEALQKPSLILRPENSCLLHKINCCANDCSGYF